MSGLSRPIAVLLAALSLLAYARVARADDDDDDMHEEIQQLQQMENPQTAKPASPAELEAMAKQILQTVSKTRQLDIKRDVAMEVATREQIVGYVDSRMKEEMKPNELSGQEAALKRLGLVPESLDMKKFMLELYGEQVAGYYDPFKQKFFIASWMSPTLQAPIMAHELTHALQDQRWNLKPFLTPIPDNSDATSARQAVVEGDAVISMFAFIGSGLGGADLLGQGSIGTMIRSSMASSQYPIFAGAPGYFQESLFFPYADGADFIQKVKANGGWTAVDKLYADLPKSSEQVMHPEKYLAKRDDPKPVDLSMKLPGWREVNTDVLGELVMRTLFEGYTTKDDAARIAAGWGGDRYRAFQKDKGPKGLRGTMVVLRTTWDTETDAKEFADGWTKLVPKKYDGATAAPDAKGTTFKTVEDGLSRVERVGNDVVVVDAAPDAETLGAAMNAAWSRPGK